MKRTARFIALTVALTLLGAVSCDEDDDDGGDDATPRPTETWATAAPEDADATGQIAQTFAPVIYLASPGGECDGTIETDAYAPMQVSDAVGQTYVRLGVEGSPELGIVSPALSELSALYPERASDLYLDFLVDANPLWPSHRCRFEEAYRGIRPRPALYARIVTSASRTAVQYWFYYYFNDWLTRHEGDWEMIQLTFESTDLQGIAAGDVLPASLAYSQHAKGKRYEVVGDTWANVASDVAWEQETHPVVYVGAGSHANYTKPSTWVSEGIGDFFPRLAACNFAAEPDDAQRLAFPQDYDVLVLPTRPGQAEWSWWDYRGKWGQPGILWFDGPTGPVTQGKSQDPGDWSDHLDEESCVLRELGQNVAAFGSRLLGRSQRILVEVSIPDGDDLFGVFSWFGSDVTTVLIEPGINGRRLDKNSPEVEYESGPTFEAFRVANAKGGVWKLEIYGAVLPPEGEFVTWEVYNIAPRCSLVDDADRDTQDADLDGINNAREAALPKPTNPCQWDSQTAGQTDAVSAGIADAPTSAYFRGLSEAAEAAFGQGATPISPYRVVPSLPAADDQDVLRAYRDSYDRADQKYKDFESGVQALVPPSGVEGLHDDLLQALEDYEPEFFDAIDALINAVPTGEEAQKLIDELVLRPSAIAVHDACWALQRTADARGYALTLATVLGCLQQP